MSGHPDFPLPKAKPLTQAEVAEKRKVAFEFEAAIKAAIAQIHTDVWVLAERLWAFHEEHSWRLLGYETLNDFLAQPEIGMSRRSFFRLVQVWDELVVSQKVPAPALSGIDPSKVFEVVSAIKRGEVEVDQALADAKSLGFRDLREKYSQKQLPSEEVDKVQCDHCGSWRYPDEVEEWRLAKSVEDGTYESVIKGTGREQSTVPMADMDEQSATDLEYGCTTNGHLDAPDPSCRFCRALADEGGAIR